jgi:F420-dependent oxidoreductase-like protein
VRVSLNVTDYAWPGGPDGLGAELERVVRIADEGGLDTVWLSDHLIQAAPGSTPDSEMLEAYTALGFLAGLTRRVRLGTMVAAATYREPAVLVKAVTTLDVLSAGRAWLGIGAGYQEDEARALGLPLPAVGERFERLEETLRLALQMWSGDLAPFRGRHYTLERPVSSPQPVTRPHPTILIGGAGERKTLRLVARYGDACNLFDIPDGGATVRHKLAVLQRLCAEAGRPYDEIEKTIATRLPPGESAASFVQRCEGFAELGIDHAGVITTGPWTEEAVAVLAEAVPALDKLGR